MYVNIQSCRVFLLKSWMSPSQCMIYLSAQLKRFGDVVKRHGPFSLFANSGMSILINELEKLCFFLFYNFRELVPTLTSYFPQICIFCPKGMCESESEVAQSFLTLCDAMDCSLPGSSVHGNFQACVLEWVAISFSRRSSRCRYADRTSQARLTSTASALTWPWTLEWTVWPGCKRHSPYTWQRRREDPHAY